MAEDGIVLDNLTDIPASMILDRIELEDNGPIEYSHARIIGDLDLSSLDNTKREEVEITVLQRALGVSENARVVNNRIRIINSKFMGKVNCNNIIFKEPINFNGCIFYKDISFIGTRFYKRAVFRDATFNGETNFSASKFFGNAYFGETKYLKNSSYQLVFFKQNAIFYNSRFEKDLNFNNTLFKGDLSLEKFYHKGKLFFEGVRFDHLKVEWERLKSNGMDCDGPTYTALVENFKDLGQFDDQDNCNYTYRTIRRKRDLNGWKKAIDYIPWLFYGYGVRFYYPLIWMIGIFIFSTYIYIWGGQEAPPNAFGLSLVILTTTSQVLNSNHASLTGLCWYCSIVERLLGWLLMSTFLVALAKNTLR